MQWRPLSAIAAEHELVAQDSMSEGEDVPPPEQEEVPEGCMPVHQVEVSEELKQRLLDRNIENLFPIQVAVMKPGLEGRDLMARAKTGTGKTLAYGLPVLEQLLQEEAHYTRGRNPRCVVLAPTRELAKQVENEFNLTTPNLRTICFYGGASITAQSREIRRGVDVAVGTPGRIIDLLERGWIDFRDVKHCILDEADQMLSVGFDEAVEEIMSKMPDNRQNMLFSATMPNWVQKLSRQYLRDPEVIDLVGTSDDKAADTIKFLGLQVPSPSARRPVLVDLISVYGNNAKSIIFTATKREADDLTEALQSRIAVEVLHGDIAQNQRERTLDNFRTGKINVLVATDVAARGLDIPNVDLVVHFDFPDSTEAFLHRSGRTGRANKKGTAILMYTRDKIRTMNRLARDTGANFDTMGLPTPEEVLTSCTTGISSRLDAVHPEMSEKFFEAAQKKIDESGSVEALAAAYAVMSGFTEPPAPRSLLTYEKGFVSVGVWGKKRGVIQSPSDVMRELRRLGLEVQELGLMRLATNASGDRGAVVDVPQKVFDEMSQFMGPDQLDMLELEKLHKLPAMDERGGRGDRYGGGGHRRGGYNRRDNYGGRRDYGRGDYGRDRRGGDRSGWNGRRLDLPRSNNSGNRYGDYNRDGGRHRGEGRRADFGRGNRGYHGGGGGGGRSGGSWSDY